MISRARMNARGPAGLAATLGLACAFAAAPAVVAGPVTETPWGYWGAPYFVIQAPRPGLTIADRRPLLMVNCAAADRQVVIAWLPPPDSLLETAHAIRAQRPESCLVEGRSVKGDKTMETWWLDRARGLLVCADPEAWYAANAHRSKWALKCHALGVEGPPDAFAPSLLTPAIERYDVPAGDSTDVFNPETDRAAEVLEYFPLTYPPIAIERDEQALVNVRALVGENGIVLEAYVDQSSPDFDAAALDCVRRWKFLSAYRRGKPMRMWAQVPARFTLQ